MLNEEVGLKAIGGKTLDVDLSAQEERVGKDAMEKVKERMGQRCHIEE